MNVASAGNDCPWGALWRWEHAHAIVESGGGQDALGLLWQHQPVQQPFQGNHQCSIMPGLPLQPVIACFYGGNVLQGELTHKQEKYMLSHASAVQLSELFALNMELGSAVFSSITEMGRRIASLMRRVGRVTCLFWSRQSQLIHNSVIAQQFRHPLAHGNLGEWLTHALVMQVLQRTVG